MAPLFSYKNFTISCINKEDDDIARKYEEICAPQVEEFCYITDNTYFRDEVLYLLSICPSAFDR
jgi:hypothetical protein